MTIGWVGLGNIGTNMVVRLLKAGHDVTVFARGAGLDEARAAGAKVCFEYATLASNCDALGICVFSDAQLQSVLFDRGALAAMRPGTVLFMHTTGTPEVARDVGAKAPEGVAILDATFSGSASNVLTGELVIMVGGETEAIERIRPLLQAYAKDIHRVGPLGQGQMLKLLNNLLFAANLRNAEALLKMASALGFVTRDVASVIQTCSGGSYALRSFQSDRPYADALTASRPYVEKDVAAVVASMAKVGIDISDFAPTVQYFQAV
jgi:3-hydroxyisobutyrate dehydrogenase